MNNINVDDFFLVQFDYDRNIIYLYSLFQNQNLKNLQFMSGYAIISKTILYVRKAIFFDISQTNLINPIKQVMQKLIKRCDMFSIIQFTRYNGQKSYRTLTGGIISILVYGSLLTIFVGLLTETLNYTNITVTNQDINFQLNPTYYELVANRANHFMFAVGATGKNIDLSMFDVVLQNHLIFNKEPQKSSKSQPILLQPCNFSQWAGISQQVTQSFHGLNLKSYLCPPKDFILKLQGKPTSEIFKYAMISVAQCGKFNPNAICNKSHNNPEQNFDLNQRLNFFYINSQINPKNKDAASYYIEDINIFDLDLRLGFTASIYFSEYEITTDRSLLPWSSNHAQKGIYTKRQARTQSHTLQDKIYAQIILRKSSQNLIIQRSFQKITKPISYIGGLSNPILLVLSVLRMYTIYAYQIQFGGKIFKQQTNSSFDSQNFNFITYIKCRIYNIFKKFSFTQNWKSIKDYYECRRQSIKQLDVHLIYKKMQFFEQALNLMLQSHYQIGLHLLPKRSIQASQKARLKYFYRNSISQQEKKQDFEESRTIQEHRKFIQKQKESQSLKAEYQKLLELQKQFSSNYKILKRNSQSGDQRAKEIMKKLVDDRQKSNLISMIELYPEQLTIQNVNLTFQSELVDTEINQKAPPDSKSPKF